MPCGHLCTARAQRAFYREKLGNCRAISNILAYTDHATPPHWTQYCASLLEYFHFFIPLMAPKASTILCSRSSFTNRFVTSSATLALPWSSPWLSRVDGPKVADLFPLPSHQPRGILLRLFRLLVVALWHFRTKECCSCVKVHDSVQILCTARAQHTIRPWVP